MKSPLNDNDQNNKLNQDPDMDANEELSQVSYRQKNKQPLDDDYFTYQELHDLQAAKQKASENEFRYHSIKDDLIRQRQEQSRVHRKSNLLSDLFQKNYEEYYDLNKLEPIQSYNQFPEEAEKEETPVADNSNEAFEQNADLNESQASAIEASPSDAESSHGIFQALRRSINHLQASSEQIVQRKEKKKSFLDSIAQAKMKIKNFRQDATGLDQPSSAESMKQNDQAEIQDKNRIATQELEKDQTVYYVRDRENMDRSELADNENESFEQVDPVEIETTPSAPNISAESSEEEQAIVTTEPEEEQTEEPRLSADQNQNNLEEEVLSATTEFQEPILTDTVLSDVTAEADITIEQKIHEEKDEIDRSDKLIKKDNFVSGAAWLSVGYVISRVIGALYVIPWATWFGEGWKQANTLYSAGYKPYSLFLAIGTAGFPSAIAKQMALYHAKREYRVADRLFKHSLMIMLATGLISGLILFILAPFLAEMSPNVNKEGAVLVLRSLVPALLILPMMSLFRGYFQGFNDMKPSAVSQLLEQFARVIYMLVATYAIMVVMKGEVTPAVVQSTFAAFIGALVSLVYLVIIYLRRLPDIKQLLEQSEDKITVDFKDSLKIMTFDSIPFIILGSGIIIMQLIDTYSFGKILEKSSILLLTEIDELYGVMSLDVDKLIMIIISLSIALSSAFVPSLTGVFAQKKYEETAKMVQHILSVFFMVMIPSAIGLMAISDNIYQLFYPLGSEMGPALLITGSFTAIILGLYTVLSTILQSMNFRRLAVRFLVVGIIVKILLQYPLVVFFQAHGALLSTMFALAISSLLMWIKLNRVLKFNTYQLTLDFIKILVPALLMGVAALMWNRVFNLLFGPVGRLLTFSKVMMVVIIAVFIYLVLLAVQGMLSILIGDRYQALQEKIRIKL
ncbi:putative polysaccharide biosynthesis protein [Ignavigranum ruoffiae]|uniref:putative polysaccharide biosynthesis protein n=1 Tax=Ignavigranum ruoffiae TaxID=89093 RepID=UPI0023554604|nr:oligosaccharide flippase family protein [Ignavigranum ruoffiae]